MKISRKLWIGGAAALVLTAIGTAALRDPPLPVDTGLVTRGAHRVTVDEEGRTRVRDRFVITAPVSGRLERITLLEGSEVRPGDVVARLAPLPLDAQAVAQARARVSAARALRLAAETRVRQARELLEQARRTARRQATLAAAGAIAPSEREDADVAVRVREEELAAAQSQTRAAAAEVEEARAALLALGGDASPQPLVLVRAPVGGRVLRLPDRSERVVTAGTPLLELGDAHALEVVADLLSSDAVRVQPNDPVLIESWGGGAPLAGRVRGVGRSGFTKTSALGVEEQRVELVVDLPDAPPTLGDGYRVDVRVVVWEGRDVLTVPASALVRTGSGWGVFTVEDGRALWRPVEVGHDGGDRMEISRGIEEGDELVLFPSDQVRDGVRVRARA